MLFCRISYFCYLLSHSVQFSALWFLEWTQTFFKALCIDRAVDYTHMWKTLDLGDAYQASLSLKSVEYCIIDIQLMLGNIYYHTLLHDSVLLMNETWSCTVIWNVPIASVAGTKLVLYAPYITKGTAQFSTHSRVWYYITMHSHSAVKKL